MLGRVLWISTRAAEPEGNLSAWKACSTLYHSNPEYVNLGDTV